MPTRLFVKHKPAILYGCLLAVLLFLLKWLELRFIIMNHSMEIYIGAIALLFTGLGIWLAMKLAKPKTETIIIEKEIIIKEGPNFIQDAQQTETIGLSKRETEVLLLIAEGLSNNEIAERLFVSLATIKTHTTRIFEKMDVQRRTQAIEKAKRLKIIA